MPSVRPDPQESHRMEFAIPQTIAWKKGRLKLIDQTKLPDTLSYIYCDTVEQVWDAIKKLKVRGAPAIGIAAAFGVLVALKNNTFSTSEELIRKVDEAAAYLASSRPTAVNLTWALQRMRAVAHRLVGAPPKKILAALEKEAVTIHEEDRELCRKIGEHGATLIRSGQTVLTHCNAGALATGGMGTALAPIFVAHARGKKVSVFADETRPLLQGARLTAWELMKAGVNVTLICDNMAGYVMKEGKIDLVITGADRIAANGDVANKIGTYGVATLAKAHGIPFYVAAPSSTFDLTIRSGAEIPIEQRYPEEVTEGFGKRTAPRKVNVFNPAFDVTPARLVTALITEKGIIYPPYKRNIPAVLVGRTRLKTRRNKS
ncbi:MAG: S-methyl-5-thioribose-1-phosphate isomerase [Candidatus Abyssubacteria bacterium]